ncbi:hypothetical protein [Nocardia jejuensis]|uniref:hypothetical protein n=1 Tax=Nocardia jejuensis TaxID=328049 RepID=UPI000835CB38|nr:hypothetical protein [Nocardia jejuensis]
MDDSLTAQRAQQRIYELMKDTLRGLPVGAGLSKTPGSPLLGKFDKPYPLTVPCWEGNVRTEGPHYLRTAYWVIGVPAGATRDYFDRIKKVWSDQGWSEENTSEWVWVVRTGDGFGLQLQDADKGDGSLSITGSSPCVPESALEPLDPDPSEITVV